MIIIKSEWCILNNFKTASQLRSYVGVISMIREARSSARFRARISKVCTRKLR
ncbi:transposase [Cellulophaga sp. Z1A5H]|uniref:transposase n=1 Tax=Cellulophaga sp. Z1A5H TaxID=2687291 RepID=UPI0013FD730B|nr:transposase [Cellulophaga sp. Z1A5H]